MFPLRSSCYKKEGFKNNSPNVLVAATCRDRAGAEQRSGVWGGPVLRYIVDEGVHLSPAWHPAGWIPARRPRAKVLLSARWRIGVTTREILRNSESFLCHLPNPKPQQKELSWSWYLGQMSRPQPGLQWEERFPPMCPPLMTRHRPQEDLLGCIGKGGQWGHGMGQGVLRGLRVPLEPWGIRTAGISCSSPVNPSHTGLVEMAPGLITPWGPSAHWGFPEQRQHHGSM